jgi:SAM-dependent methyltransferase
VLALPIRQGAIKTTASHDMNLLLKKKTLTSGSIPLDVYGSFQSWQQKSGSSVELHESRRRFEQSVAILDTSDVFFGWCCLCGHESIFHIPSKLENRPTNFREELVCEGCGTNARVRAGLQILGANRSFETDVLYITEQASPTYVWLQGRVKHLTGSEFVHDDAIREAMQRYLIDLGGRGTIRFEDVTRLTFSDASLDAIASFDVLEHVPDYTRALTEFARTLKPGGTLVLTAPFISSNEHTVVRARIDHNGAVEHLMQPEYHGDPKSSDGILCFYHFGWDLLDTARDAGFKEVCMAKPWLPGMGLMDHLWTLVAIR